MFDLIHCHSCNGKQNKQDKKIRTRALLALMCVALMIGLGMVSSFAAPLDPQDGMATDEDGFLGNENGDGNGNENASDNESGMIPGLPGDPGELTSDWASDLDSGIEFGSDKTNESDSGTESVKPIVPGESTGNNANNGTGNGNNNSSDQNKDDHSSIIWIIVIVLLVVAAIIVIIALMPKKKK